MTEPDSAAIDDLVGRLRFAGVRVTPARRAVLRALAAGGPHPTADDLAEHVAADHPEIHRSTVYRTLDALTELDLVNHVHLGHGRAVYHLTGDDDLHLHCDQCGAVSHVAATMLTASSDLIRDETGFLIQPGHFALPGRCADCRTGTPDD